MSISHHKPQPCTQSCRWSRASCRRRCTHRTRVRMSRCTPRPDHQHTRRKCGRRRGQGESRNRSDGGTGHSVPWGALNIVIRIETIWNDQNTYGDRACHHSQHWSSGHRAPSFLRKGQRPDHLDRGAPLGCHQNSHSICHTVLSPRSIHPSLDRWNLTELEKNKC